MERSFEGSPAAYAAWMETLSWERWPFDAAEWDELNDATHSHPGLHSINVKLLLKHFGTGKECCWVCWRGNSVIAMTILTGRFIATNFHPSQQTVALWVQREGEDFGVLVTELAKHFLMLSITHVDPDMLGRPDLETVDYIETARTRIAGSFEDYWKARKRSLRDNLRSYGNRLERNGITPRMDVLRDPDKMGEAVNAYGLLESVGWKGETAIHPDNKQGAYYRELLTAYAVRGWASIWQCHYGDKLVASNLLIHRDGTVLSLKITYDEQHAKTSPSLLLRYHTFEQIWPETTEIEYYGKEKGWGGWEDERRTLYHVNVYRPWVKRLKESALKARRASAFLSSRMRVAKT